MSKNGKSGFLKQQLEQKQFGISWNFIMSYKGIDSSIKILLNLMLNDYNMNGSITWKQQTYADKLGLTRQQVHNLFKKLQNADVLVADWENKAGSKSNTYTIDITKLGNLVSKKKGFKPVKQDVQTCKEEFTSPVKQDVQTCKPDFTYNKNNKDSKKSLILEEGEPSKGSPSLDEVGAWIATLNIDI